MFNNPSPPQAKVLRKAIALFLLSVALNHAAQATSVRISTLEFQQDQAKVASLQKAIAKMRELSKADPMSAEFRTSFAYWSNTHGYFGKGTHATDKAAWFASRLPGCLASLGQTVCDHYYKHLHDSIVPNDGFTDNIWGTCQHGNLNFLPWHRIYLYYFEKTVRKYSDDPNFALPYWNYYSEPNPALKGLALPTLVRGSATQPLFNEFRTPGLNANQAAIDPDTASAKLAFSYNDFTNFSNQLQGQPHGVMHCAVGQGCVIPDMGFVPVAGLDPVFYMHHANIDRLWQCWLRRKANGQPITLEWAKANLGMPESWYDTTYSFVDENGAEVQMSIGDVFVPGMIDVAYDDSVDCAVTADPKTKQETLAQAGPSILSAHRPVGHLGALSLRGKTAQVALDAVPEAKLQRNASLLDANSTEAGQSYLVLSQVTMRGIPALSYKIYIASEADPSKQSYIATFNYFGVGEHGGHGGISDSGLTSLGTLVYQITSNLQEVGVRTADDLVVRFVPTNMLSGGEEAMTAQEDAGLDIAEIRLETLPEK